MAISTGNIKRLLAQVNVQACTDNGVYVCEVLVFLIFLNLILNYG